MKDPKTAIEVQYLPHQGAAYSLFGRHNQTEDYFKGVKILVDKLLVKFHSGEKLLALLRKASRFRSPRMAMLVLDANEIRDLDEMTFSELSGFTLQANKFNHSLPLHRKITGVIPTSRWQYHLYMTEIELLNRMNVDSFMNANYRIALLPHCLRDLERDCRAKPDEIDYRCGRCSGKCYVRAASDMLAGSSVNAYIWMQSDLKKLLKLSVKEHGTIGVLGIACVPELARGMRRCDVRGIPVIGLPLDGNRCVRWLGKFHPNSINLAKLDELLSGTAIR